MVGVYYITTDKHTFSQSLSSETNNLLLMIAYIQRKRRPETFQRKLNVEGRAKRDRRISRREIRHPSMSTFFMLFGRGCERSMITLTGFNHHDFSCITEKFGTLYDTFSPYYTDGKIRLLPMRSIKRGRLRIMTSTQCLGLLIEWN